MRVLLDECLPRRLGAKLTGHTVSTVPQAGWAGTSNGQLLSRIEGRFDAFVTIDANLPAQQRMDRRAFGVVVIGGGLKSAGRFGAACAENPGGSRCAEAG